MKTFRIRRWETRMRAKKPLRSGYLDVKKGIARRCPLKLIKLQTRYWKKPNPLIVLKLDPLRAIPFKIWYSFKEVFPKVLRPPLILKPYQKKDRILRSYFGTQGGTRTPTSEESGFWIRRVYQFRHLGILLKEEKGVWMRESWEASKFDALHCDWI